MFFPRKSKILDLLDTQAEKVVQAAQVFEKIAIDRKYWKEGSTDIKKIEAEADEYIRTVIDEIEAVFILPFDKEDIKEIAELLDDIIDNLEEAANRINIFNLVSPTGAMKAFSVIIKDATTAIKKCVELIRDGKLSSPEYAKSCSLVRELEHKGDKLHRDTLEKLMTKPDKKNVLVIVNWKEIYQILEDTVDKCDHLAVVFERLRIKYTG